MPPETRANAEIRKGEYDRYARLSERLLSAVGKGVGEALIQTAEATLDSFPAAETFNPNEVASCIRGSLPPRPKMLCKELCQIPAIPLSCLKEAADAYECAALRDAAMTLCKLANEERSNRGLMLLCS